jgi:hypothetical protein
VIRQAQSVCDEGMPTAAAVSAHAWRQEVVMPRLGDRSGRRWKCRAPACHLLTSVLRIFRLSQGVLVRAVLTRAMSHDGASFGLVFRGI